MSIMHCIKGCGNFFNEEYSMEKGYIDAGGVLFCEPCWKKMIKDLALGIESHEIYLGDNGPSAEEIATVVIKLGYQRENYPSLRYFKWDTKVILNDMIDVWNKHFEASRKAGKQTIRVEYILQSVFLEIISKIKKELGV